jgi:hypothetical protein
MTDKLKTIPPNATRLIKACFVGFDMMSDDMSKCTQSLWKTTEGNYLIERGSEIVEPETLSLIQWINIILKISSLYYGCHPDVDVPRLRAELIAKNNPTL